MSSYTNNLHEDWDCIVIGAGPAGSIAARQIAKENRKVLLIDKEIFPRSKVCGCCINGKAVELLISMDLQEILTNNGAIPLHGLRLYSDKKFADLSLSGGYSLSREKFDMALVNAAITEGVKFLPGMSARIVSIDNLPIIGFQSGGENYQLQAKTVIVADGLSGGALDLLPQFKSKVQNKSLFGVSTILNQSPDYIESGKIHMICGEGGYVGMVILEDGRLNIAAALNLNYSRKFGSVNMAVTDLFKDNNLALPRGLTESHWKGTSLLTRKRSQLAEKRLFIIGDSCGYSEPFTGQGMSWALRSGVLVSRLANESVDGWKDNFIGQWHIMQNQLNVDRLPSRCIALGLRNRLFRSILINIGSVFPGIGNRFIQMINGRHSKHREIYRGEI